MATTSISPSEEELGKASTSGNIQGAEGCQKGVKDRLEVRSWEGEKPRIERRQVMGAAAAAELVVKVSLRRSCSI